ncbi:type II toxin-antitoxin system Phd/YefM family antitoxin [Arthrobacter sp. H5]|uniref:type II toxin-antitoxin system Phd/YefM family antitoxin n=1 Tax=Arthrobacter sp. H5 TaxID=1267973 RepID=UPI00047F143C|nr:type II toxin-antitoxin system Phd/YefM family antitoxin [Arthrobacter sp. H5]
MTTLSIADARANFSKIVESASITHERFDVTRNGRRAAVLLGAEDYDSLIETLEILGNPEVLTAIRAGLRDLGAGSTVDAETVRKSMIQSGRLKG